MLCGLRSNIISPLSPKPLNWIIWETRTLLKSFALQCIKLFLKLIIDVVRVLLPVWLWNEEKALVINQVITERSIYEIKDNSDVRLPVRTCGSCQDQLIRHLRAPPQQNTHRKDIIWDTINRSLGFRCVLILAPIYKGEYMCQSVFPWLTTSLTDCMAQI